jgi:hypothetical protein
MIATNLLTTALAAATFLSTISVAAPVKGFSTNILISRQSNLKFPFFTEKVRGVNLGGWFVLEPWITPSVFANQPGNVVDEFTLTQQLGNEAATSLLSNHWNTWITQVCWLIYRLMCSKSNINIGRLQPDRRSWSQLCPHPNRYSSNHYTINASLILTTTRLLVYRSYRR